MKSHRSISLGLAGLLFAACQPEVKYVPVPGPTKVVYKTKPAPRPLPKPKAESAEDFRAVEKPTTYSN